MNVVHVDNLVPVFWMTRSSFGIVTLPNWYASEDRRPKTGEADELKSKSSVDVRYQPAIKSKRSPLLDAIAQTRIDRTAPCNVWPSLDRF